MRPRSVVILACSAAMGLARPAGAESARPTSLVASDDPKLPFETFRLDNGLTVVLHVDRTAPVVAVNTMFDVGSRHESPGRTGFAHLFEHLMFMGTTRVPTGAFDAWMEEAGGWNNAWTSDDRTDYFDVGPSHALPLLLWLEADRFASVGADMTEEKLEAQRKVVRNERRQTSENEPYGKAELRLPELLYPKGHPYHHPVIGSHEDLEAAKVEDVRKFFADWYVPKNAVMVIAGDFEPEAVKADVRRLFGGLPATAPPAAPPAPPVRLTSVVRETMEDDVELAKIVFAWHSPALYAPGDADLDILASVLDQGKSSRLYKALVFDKPLAQSVSAMQASREEGSHFQIEVVAQRGVSLDELEKKTLAVLRQVVDEGVRDEEVMRARNEYETSFVRRLESVQARASQLASYASHQGDPGYLMADLTRYRSVSAQTAQKVARDVLDPQAMVVMRIVPRAQPAAPAAPAGGAR